VLEHELRAERYGGKPDRLRGLGVVVPEPDEADDRLDDLVRFGRVAGGVADDREAFVLLLADRLLESQDGDRAAAVVPVLGRRSRSTRFRPAG
jgi:hypothetical protein